MNDQIDRDSIRNQAHNAAAAIREGLAKPSYGRLGTWHIRRGDNAELDANLTIGCTSITLAAAGMLHAFTGKELTGAAVAFLAFLVVVTVAMVCRGYLISNVERGATLLAEAKLTKAQLTRLASQASHDHLAHCASPHTRLTDLLDLELAKEN